MPLKFIKRDGKIVVRGLIQGVVHKADGTTRTFGVVRTLRVKSINGTPATTSPAASSPRPPPATC